MMMAPVGGGVDAGRPETMDKFDPPVAFLFQISAPGWDSPAAFQEVSGLETRLGLARSTTRFGSESLFGLTQS